MERGVKTPPSVNPSLDRQVPKILGSVVDRRDGGRGISKTCKRIQRSRYKKTFESTSTQILVKIFLELLNQH